MTRKGLDRHPKWEQNTVVITKLKKAPRFNMVINCYERSIDKWRELVDKVSTKKTLKAFKNNFQRELEVAFDFVRRHPCLFSDFQLMIDGEGKVYHIDLDRCLGGGKPRRISYFETCVAIHEAAVIDLGLNNTVFNLTHVFSARKELVAHSSGRLTN